MMMTAMTTKTTTTINRKDASLTGVNQLDYDDDEGI